MAKSKARRKGSVAPRPRSVKPGDANGAHEPSPNGTREPSPTNGLNHALEHATRVLGGALGGGYTGARAAAGMLAPDAMAAALMVCMPDEWTEDEEVESERARARQQVASWTGRSIAEAGVCTGKNAPGPRFHLDVFGGRARQFASLSWQWPFFGSGRRADGLARAVRLFSRPTRRNGFVREPESSGNHVV
jgi:hypothetical protein